MTDKEQNQHTISQFYLRGFTFDTTEKRAKNKKRVYTLNHKGIVESRKINGLCSIAGYNTEFEESLFTIGEKIMSDSVNAILTHNYNSIDIDNVKYLIAYFLSNDPDIREQIINHYDKSTGGKLRYGIKRKGILTAILAEKIHQSLSNSEYYIERIKPTDNKQFITSDKPIYINPILRTSNFGFLVFIF